MGAPVNNKNATRHGLTLGSALPKGTAYISRSIVRFRLALEAAVVAARGAVGLYEAAAIQTACRWERHALLAQRWLRVEKQLDPDQRLTFSREIARASTERDKCLKLLGIDATGRSDPWAALDAASKPAAVSHDPSAIHAASNAADAKPGDSVGNGGSRPIIVDTTEWVPE
jgi:hypothetical protein